MNKINRPIRAQKIDDTLWVKRFILIRLLVFCFRSSINQIAKRVLTTGHERNIITSEQLHELAAIVDRMLFPEYEDDLQTQSDSWITQSNIRAGGDIAGRDINK